MIWSNARCVIQLPACYPALCGFTMKLGGFFMNNTKPKSAPSINRVAFTLDEVAAMLGATVKQIRGDINANRLKAIRVGRSLRVTQKAIDRYTGEAN